MTISKTEFEKLVDKVTETARAAMLALLANPEYLKQCAEDDSTPCMLEDAARDGWDAAIHFMDIGSETVIEIAERFGMAPIADIRTSEPPTRKH